MDFYILFVLEVFFLESGPKTLYPPKKMENYYK